MVMLLELMAMSVMLMILISVLELLDFASMCLSWVAKAPRAPR